MRCRRPGRGYASLSPPSPVSLLPQAKVQTFHISGRRGQVETTRQFVAEILASCVNDVIIIFAIRKLVAIDTRGAVETGAIDSSIEDGLIPYGTWRFRLVRSLVPT